MTVQLMNHLPAAVYAPLPIPHAAMEILAGRFRSGGLCFMAFLADGTLAYHDADAGLYFQRYVLPALEDAEGRAKVGAAIRTIDAEAGTVESAWLPGATFAVVPYVDKRQLQGVLVLAAKSAAVANEDDARNVCARLGVDGQWLEQQANLLPSYGRDAIVQQGQLLLGMVRDQVRLAGMERELDSLSGQLANTYEELALIYQLSSGMKINRGVGDFFKQACLDVMELMSVRGMGVALRGDRSGEMEAALYGALTLPVAPLARLADELLLILQERKEPLLVHHLGKHKTLNWLGEYADQIIAVPLMRQDQVLGLMFGIDKIGKEFDSVDAKLLNSIANESAIYLENAMLFDDVHGLMMGLLHSLTSAVDAKDAYTCGHSERVALFSRELARKAGLAEPLVERIYMAGLLHDVGKIGVPEAVLQKAGRLTPEEFELMKRHPEVGARILRDIKQIEDIIPGVMHHHERYDGKGYPTGLAGDDIPLMGRIICLADCFDAMTSNRTYRKALPLEVAMTEIRRCAGTQFDPLLTDAFLGIGEDNFRSMLRQHHEQNVKTIDITPPLRTAG